MADNLNLAATSIAGLSIRQEIEKSIFLLFDYRKNIISEQILVEKIVSRQKV